MNKRGCDECGKECIEEDMWLCKSPPDEDDRIESAFCSQTCLIKYMGCTEPEEELEDYMADVHDY